jgi:acylglycerol lipase
MESMEYPEYLVKEFVTEDGIRLCYREWTPKKAKAVVICLHGIRSHGAWYIESCIRLCRSGYRVLFADRRGSGLNRDRGGGNLSYQKWVDDVERLVRCAVKNEGKLPVHLMGVSWGGRLAAVVAAGGRVRFDSLILAAPGIVSLIHYPLYRRIAVLWAILFKSPRTFPIPLEDASLFTDDPDERNYIEEDKLGLRRVSARFLFESYKLARIARAQFTRIRIPLLLLLAGRDRIVNNGMVEKLFTSCESTDKIIKLYQKARHTLEFDACRNEYFDDLVKWFDCHS